MRPSIKKLQILAFLLGIIAFPAIGNGMTLTGIASEFPPLQIKEGNAAKGFAVELVELLINRLEAKGRDLDWSMQIMPWKRAMNQALLDPNTLFFSISRTDEREEKFHWIGEIAPYSVYMTALRDGLLKDISSLDDLIAAKPKVGVQDSSNSQVLLEKRGLIKHEDFSTYSHFKQGLRMLFSGRIEVMPLTLKYSGHTACTIGLDSKRLKGLFVIEELSRPLWLVASKDTAEQIVDALREEFAAMIADGTVAKVQDQHIKAWNEQPCKGN